MKAIFDILLIIVSISLLYFLFFKKHGKINNENLGNLTYKVGATETFYLEDTRTYGGTTGNSLFGYLLKDGKAYEALFSKNASIMFPDKENCGSILVLDNESFNYTEGFVRPVIKNGELVDFVETSALARDCIKCTYWTQNYGTEENPIEKINFIFYKDGLPYLTVWNNRAEKAGYQKISVTKKDTTWTVFSPEKATAYRSRHSGHTVNVNSFDTINDRKVYKVNYSDAN